jgi:signal peptidase I
LPAIAKVGATVAFVIAALVVASALIGQIVVLPFALVPLMAGIGILRRRAWGAYGFALYQVGQLLLAPLLLLRSGSATAEIASVVIAAAWTAGCALIFYLVGRSLTAQGSPRGWAWPWITLTALATVPLIFVQAFVIPTGAMENTLLIGDRILVLRLPNPAPRRDALVVHIYPIDRQQTFVKRIAGMPGDRIRIAHKVLYRNGAALQEPYVEHTTQYEDPYRDNFPAEPNTTIPAPAMEMLAKNVVNGEVVVPEGKYFVLGDNRDNSLDSRYWGFIDARDLIGKPLVIYYSEEQARGSRHVRWNRIPRWL